ncbi:MAG: radical SAM protein [bacterium]
MTTKKIKIAWVGKHFGEEPPLVGNERQGAGGIFFSGCNLRCVFCQNYQISQEDLFNQEITPEGLAEIMLNLERQGSVNIDLVTPTIWYKQIKEALTIAKKNGLKIPIVWNSNGYESIEIIKEMAGLVDIYLPDFKYGIEEIGWKYSKVKQYPQIAKIAISEMYRQVGNLEIKNGLAKKGLIIRHLVIPGNLENSYRALDIIAEIDKDIHLSLLNQYFPVFKAKEYPEINREVTEEEFEKIQDYALRLGFENGWIQTDRSSETFLPDFKKSNPFI